MAEYAKQRFLKMVDYICTMKLPFNSLIMRRMMALKKSENRKSFECKISVLLIKLLIETESFIQDVFTELTQLHYEIAERLKSPLNKKRVERFQLYQSLKRTNLPDKQIFEIMFEKLSDGSESFDKFYGNMRKWKCVHKELLEFNSRKIIYKDKINWRPISIRNNKFAYFIDKLPLDRKDAVNDLKKRLVKLFADDENKDEPPKFLYYHFLIAMAIREIRRIRSAVLIYNDYMEDLNIISILTAFENSTKWKELNCIAEGKRVKAFKYPREANHNTDFFRSLAAINTSPENEYVYASKVRTYRRKYKKIKEEYFNVVPSSRNLREEDYTFCYNRVFDELLSLNNEKTAIDSLKIKNWQDVLELLKTFGYSPTSDIEQILKNIFNVCKRKRDWQLPKEFELKQYFESLEFRGFFDYLYKKLDKKVVIKELSGVRWHKIPAPEFHISGKENCERRIFFSPFWKK